MAGDNSVRLIATLEARVNKFERDLGRANSTARREFGAIENRAGQMSRRLESTVASASTRTEARLRGLSTAFGAAATSLRGGLVGLAAGLAGGISIAGVQSSIADLAKLNDVAERTGASASFLQQFSYAVRQSGGEAGEAAAGIQKFAINVSKAAAGGGDLAKVFEANGVAIADATGKMRPIEDLLRDFADLVKNAGSEQDQLNLATMAFGRSAGPALVLALAGGRQGLDELFVAARKTGSVLGDDLVKKAAALDDQFAELEDTISGMGKKLAVEFAGPVVATALQAMLEKLRELRGVLDAIRNMDLGKLGEFLISRTGPGALYNAVKSDKPADPRADLERQRASLQAQIAASENRVAAAAAKGLSADGSTKKLTELKADLTEVEEKIKRINENPVSVDYTPARAGYTASTRETVMPSEGGGGEDAAESKVFKLIAAFEKFSAKAYWDVNAFRAGYGSDTTTRAGGAVERVTKDTSVSQADAIRDLNRRIAEFQAGVRDKLGGAQFDAMSEEQQAALTSIAYNYGQLPDRIVKAILGGGSTGDVSKAISGLGADNGGINQRRRDEEAELFSGNTTFSQKLRDQESAEIEKKAEAIKRVVEALNLEASQIGQTAAQQRILQELQAAGVDLSSREGQTIAAKVNQIVQLNAAQQAAKVSAERLNEAREEFARTGADAAKGFVQDLRNGVSAADSLRNALDRIAEKLLDSLIDNAFNSLFQVPGGAGGGGLAGGIGSIFSSLFGGARAAGGPVSPGRAYLVGEKRPELFVPNAAGRIMPQVPKMPASMAMPGIARPSVNITTAPANISVINNSGAKVETRDQDDGRGNRRTEIMIDEAVGESISNGPRARDALSGRWGGRTKAIRR